MGQFFTKSLENTALETFEFASDLSLAAIENFRRTLGVSGNANSSTISAAFRRHKVAITFTSSNSFQQAIGLKLHKHSDLEDLLSSVCTGHIPNDLVPFALTRLAFQRSPQTFRGNADLQSVFQFFLDSERVFPTLEHANALITQALSQLTKATSSPEQRGLLPYYANSFSTYPFLRTVAPSLLENACCNYARKGLQTRPGEQSTHYSRYFAMVQSSGVGKSRALHELRRNGEQVFVVCVTLRQRENVGEPPRTPVVADFIEANVTTFYDWDIFLHAVTHQLNRRFTAAGAIPSTGQPRDDFHVDLLAKQSQFWTDVVAMFRTVQARLVAGQNKVNSSWAAIRHDVFVQQATDAGVVNHLHRSQTVLVVALDECVDALVRKCASAKFYGLQGALSYTEEKLCDTVAVLVDTDATICDFAPPDNRHASGRVVAGCRLHLPFVFFDIDISQQLMDTATAATRATVVNYREDTMLTPLATDVGGGGESLTVRCNPLLELLYCRPLFSTALVNCIAASGVASALRFCRNLLNVKLPPVPAVTTSEVNVTSVEKAKTETAAFSCASLRWDVTTHSPTLMQLLVSQRLALIRKVAPRMARVWCQYSFEPALARHVAEQMRRDENAFEAALAALSEVQVGGYLEMKEGRGNAGEMAATIVLCRAMDKAQSANAPKIAPVWLHSWLAQLFSPKTRDANWRKIFRQSAARRGVVYFHSARRIEEPLSRDVLLRYLRCGTAIISPRFEPATDIYVPVAYPKPQQAVDLEDPGSFTLGVVTVQVKNVATTDGHSTPLQEDMFTYTKQFLDGDVPLVGLVLQMNPALQYPDTITHVAQGHGTRSGNHLAAAGLGLVKYFANGFPCLPKTSPAYRTVRSLFECPPIDAHVLAMLRESQGKGDDDVRGRGADSELRRMATVIGEKMFHARPPTNVDEAATAATVMRRGGAPSALPPITGHKRQADNVEEGKEDVEDPVKGSKRTRRQSHA